MNVPLEFPPADGKENLNQAKSWHGGKAGKAVGKIGEFVALKVDVTRKAEVLLNQVTNNA